jgi:hypothetical protein
MKHFYQRRETETDREIEREKERSKHFYQRRETETDREIERERERKKNNLCILKRMMNYWFFILKGT